MVAVTVTGCRGGGEELPQTLGAVNIQAPHALNAYCESSWEKRSGHIGKRPWTQVVTIAKSSSQGTEIDTEMPRHGSMSIKPSQEETVMVNLHMAEIGWGGCGWQSRRVDFMIPGLEPSSASRRVLSPASPTSPYASLAPDNFYLMFLPVTQTPIFLRNSTSDRYLPTVATQRIWTVDAVTEIH